MRRQMDRTGLNKKRKKKSNMVSFLDCRYSKKGLHESLLVSLKCQYACYYWCMNLLFTPLVWSWSCAQETGLPGAFVGWLLTLMGEFVQGQPHPATHAGFVISAAYSLSVNMKGMEHKATGLIDKREVGNRQTRTHQDTTHTPNIVLTGSCRR